MKSELRCEDVRVDLSARLDGEVDATTSAALDEHLATCAACREHEQKLRRVRSLSRVQPSEMVPDLVEPIMERIYAEPDRRFFRIPQVRTAAIAAAAAALVVLGASLPWSTTPPETARASVIVRSVQSAARSLGTYHARYDLIERGWHERIRERRFAAEVWFAAPEKFRLEVRDLTPYPSDRWPRNDVELVADPKRYRISEPSTCPTAAIPGCAPIVAREERTVVKRQPFDGASKLPTDIAVPVETLASSNGLEVLGPAMLLGAEVQRVVLPYRQAVPLVQALQAGGNWREFHPSDEVEVWIDSETWFPLRFTVRASDAADRELWARRMGLTSDHPGEILFDARAVSFEEPATMSPSLFQTRVSGAVQDGGFIPIAFEEVAEDAPDFTAGLKPYRSGITPFGQTIVSYERGMNYLKVADDPTLRTAFAYAGPAKTVALAGGEALYQPATENSGRRVDIFAEGGRVTVETNLPRAQLLKIAASMEIAGRLPDRIRLNGGQIVRRISAHDATTFPFTLQPTWLPEGFAPTSALASRSDSGQTVTLYFQRPESSFGGPGIRIVQTPSIDRLPPTSEEVVNVRLESTTGRWSFDRSELEWIDSGVYRAVTTPGGDLASAARIARSLE